jgi:hypothetical protein
MPFLSPDQFFRETLPPGAEKMICQPGVLRLLFLSAALRRDDAALAQADQCPYCHCGISE